MYLNLVINVRYNIPLRHRNIPDCRDNSDLRSGWEEMGGVYVRFSVR